MVRFLLQQGADVSVVDEEGVKAYEAAITADFRTVSARLGKSMGCCHTQYSILYPNSKKCIL
jgi:hypothetical protein